MITSIKEKDFLDKLVRNGGILSNIEKKYNVTKDKAFEIWATNLVEHIDDMDLAYEYCIGGSDDKGVDSFIPEIDEDRTIRIIQAKLHNKICNENKRVLLESKNSLNWLEDEELEDKVKNKDLINCGKQYRKLIKLGYKVKLKVVTLGGITKNTKLELVKINEQFKKEKNNNISMEIYTLKDIKDIYEMNLSLKELGPFKGEIELKIKKDESFIKKENTTNNKYKSIVATIDAKELCDLFGANKYKLFYENVRYYKGENTEPAQGMRNNIENIEERSSFWACHNGATIVCSNFECEVDESGRIVRETIKIKDPQIINGVQTTLTLVNCMRLFESLEGVEILVKIIGTESEELATKICEGANTQNSVTKRDLRSNDEIQKNLRGHFASVKIKNEERPFYYITKQGEKDVIKDFSKAEKSRFNWAMPNEKKKIQYVNNEDVAQAYFSFIGNPSIARNNKTKLFIKQGGYYDSIFRSNISAEEYLVPTIIYNKLKAKINELTKDVNGKLNNSNISNIEKKKLEYLIPMKYSKLHCVALVGHIMKKKYGGLPDMKQSEILLERLLDSDALIDKIFKLCKDVIRVYVKTNSYNNIVDFSNKFKEDGILNDLIQELEEIVDDKDIDLKDF